MGFSTQERIPECVVPSKKSLLSRNIHVSAMAGIYGSKGFRRSLKNG
jgi:hypothetical protein